MEKEKLNWIKLGVGKNGGKEVWEKKIDIKDSIKYKQEPKAGPNEKGGNTNKEK